MKKKDKALDDVKIPMPKASIHCKNSKESYELRDVLACQVMAVLLDKEFSQRWDCPGWALLSYEMADAMMEARKK